MKTVTPDIKDILTTRFVSQLATLRKFKKYWGTTYVNGVEVFNERRYYYKTMDENMVKLAKMLGIYTDLSAKQEGVRSAWLYLNPAKAKDSSQNWDKVIMVDNLSRAMDGLREGTVVIGPSIRKNKMTSPPINTPVSNQEGLIAEIKAEFMSYWNGGFPVFTDQEDGFKALLLTYLLRSTQIPYTITSVEKINGYLTKPPSSTHIDYIRSTSSPAWRLRISFEHTPITANTDIVNMMIADLSSRSRLASKIAGGIFDAASSAYDPLDGGANDDDELLYTAQPVATSAFWLSVPTVQTVSKPGGGFRTVTTYKHYLKASILTNPTLKLEKKVEYLFDCLDSDYKKEKKKWHEYFAAVVIIVVATYFAGPAGGAAAASFTSGAVATVVLVAVTITVAAMYISIAMLAASMLGAPNVSAALGSFMKTVNPLVKVAGVIAVIAGIATIIKEGYKIAASKALEEGTKVTISEISVEIAKVALKQVIEMGPREELQTRHIIKSVDLAFGLYQKNEMRSLEKSTENYRKELQHEQSLLEQSQTSDILKEMQSTYPNILSKDNSVYADRYDKPYEWWSTPYHTGNIQATTVNALWISKV